MEDQLLFTDEEREESLELLRRLRQLLSDSLEEGDEARITRHIHHALENNEIKRDIFGLNPVVAALHTAVPHCRGGKRLRRDGVMAILLRHSVASGYESMEDIEREFGSGVAKIIHGLGRIQELYKKNPVIESENFRSLLVTFAEDMRVILIMIANRVCIMRQIKDTENVEAQRKVSMEAAYLYAPLAHKLGLYKLKSELEDLSLKYLEHDAYYHIKEKLNETKRSRDAYIERFLKPLDEKLQAAGLHYHMKGRTKSIHSIWQKMQKQHVDVDGVYDLFAIRIILQSAPEREKMECWQVFSIITDMYQSNPKRMRDWLSVPKSNGYESLHITVLGPEQKWVEVQIRTERMDDIAEHGLAAHWRYKGVKSGQSGIEEWLAGVRKALENNDGHAGDGPVPPGPEGGRGVRLHSEGRPLQAPKGATVLDFAYHIHTKVGNQCTGAPHQGQGGPSAKNCRVATRWRYMTSAPRPPSRTG